MRNIPRKQILVDAAKKKIKCPCKDCTDRQVGCHSKCEKHAEYQAECERAYKQVVEAYANERKIEKCHIENVAKRKANKLSSKKWNDYRRQG